MIKASQWFAPKWKHTDAEIRASAVASAEDQELLDALPAIARDDEDAAVRLAALKRCDDIELLHECLASEQAGSNRAWLLTRLVQHYLQQTSVDAESLQQIGQWLDALADEQNQDKLADSQIEKLAASAADIGVRRAAAQRISKQGLLGDLLSRESDPDLRSELLQRIEQASTLQRISKSLRKNNKALYQACQQRLAELDNNKQQTDANDLHAAEDLLNDITQLLHGKRAPLAAISGRDSLVPTLEQAQQRWQELAIDGSSEAGQALHRRWDNAMQILQQAASAQPAVEQAPPPPGADEIDDTQQDAAAAAQQAQAQLQQLATELDKLLERKYSNNNELETILKPWRKRWRTLWQQLDNISRADQRLQDQLINRIQAVADRLGDQQTQKQQSIAALDKLLQQALTCASDGKLHDANSHHMALNEALQACSPAAQKKFQHQHAAELRQLQAELGELRQWQRWSDNQQRRRLLTDLRAAKESDLNADALVNLVKDARQQWQQLEASEVKAGMRPLGREHALNRQFQGVCGMLMRTAKPFLQKRDNLRHERGKLIEQRLQDCDELLASEKLNIKQLLKQKRAISQSFQELGSVAGDQRKSLLQGLRERQQKLQEEMQTLSTAAQQEKQRLIRLAEKLSHEPDQTSALQQAKALQREWQQLDILPRKQEQAMWEAFRAPMDELFAEQDQQRKQQQAERQQELAQQQEIVAELEAMLEQSDAALPDFRARCEDLQQQFSQHRKPERGLLSRLRQAVDQFELRLQQAQQAREQQAWQETDAAARQQQQAVVRHLQQMTATGPAAPAKAADADALAEPLASMAQQQLQQHLQAQSQSARMTCIAAEFMAGLPSPSEDQKQRMQYQVDRLSHHLRDKQQSSPQQQLRQVRESWYACMPMHPDDYDSLQARFDRAIAAAEKVLAR